ncbi:MAG: hypothetical protein LBE18_07370 [Planctomycetaceae bacterium]|jgi:hypothetical protein|nr:hypothetical protein [Planctomycetaceae bacterium]
MLQKINNLKIVFFTSVILFGLLFVSTTNANNKDNKDNKDDPKIVVPNDAIIIPYKPDNITPNKLPKPENLTESEQIVIVPLDLHLEILNLIKSKDKIHINSKRSSPCKIIADSAEYIAEELPQTGNELILNGKIHIYQFENEGVLLPFYIRNSVIESPQLDNKPASISSVSNSQFVLRVSGQGEHIFTFKVRVKIQQQGGWRIVEGTLPKAANSRVQITLPSEAGDLLTGNPLDVRKWSSGKNESGTNKIITTTLNPQGDFSWRWRSAIFEGQVDRSLEVESVIKFDLQEDAAWILWTPTFKISRGKWEFLRLQIPKNYTITEIKGENVRGWNIVTENNNAESNSTQTINIELLKPAEKEEILQVRMIKNNPDNKSDNKESWNLSTLSVPEAGIHRGRIDLYRSSMHELRVTESKGVVLTDQIQIPSVNDMSTKFNAVNPLGTEQFQSYRFIAEPFNLTLQTKPLTKTVSIYFQSILKILHKRSILETKVEIDSNNYPFFVTIKLPKQFNLKNVTAPNMLFYSKEKHNDENLLYVSLGNIVDKKIVIGLEGDYIPISPIDKINSGKNNSSDKSTKDIVIKQQQYQLDQLPVFTAQFSGIESNLVNESSKIELLTEPSLQAEIENLKGCVRINPQSWHNYTTTPKEQRELIRLIITSQSRNPQGKIIFTEIVPAIQCSTITNVRTTSDAINETILLDFTINRAGTREIKFTLPEWMKDAVIESPFLQRKRINGHEIKNGNQTAKMIDVTLELQENVIDHLRVLVHADRKLHTEKDYKISVPIIKTGTATSQYVVMENDRMSPDEMVVEQTTIKNLKNLDRRQYEWQYLATILGENVTEAYYVQKTNSGTNAGNNSNEEASLQFKMKRRDAVRLSDAKINKSETILTFDSNGEYRAEQIYHIDNQKEPYLDIFLPDGAALWSVRFFSAEAWQQRNATQNNTNVIRPHGEPVKPCLMPLDVVQNYSKLQKIIINKDVITADSFYRYAVRIPLIKTDSGDLDYVVRIVYAGITNELNNFTNADLPFVKVMNIPVETSLLKLYLPPMYKYLFYGNMQQISKDQSNVIIKKINDEYTQKIELRLQKTLQEDNIYAQQRALLNMRNSNMFQQDNKSNNNNGNSSQINQIPQQAISQIPQAHNMQTYQSAEQSKSGSNDGNLRNQFMIQSNTFSGQLINKKSIEIQAVEKQSRQLIDDSNTKGKGFDKVWLDSMQQENAVQGQLNNEFSNKKYSAADAENYNDKNKVYSESTSQKPSSTPLKRGMTKDKQSESTRTQAVFNGNIVLGETSQIDRQRSVLSNKSQTKGNADTDILNESYSSNENKNTDQNNFFSGNVSGSGSASSLHLTQQNVIIPDVSGQLLANEEAFVIINSDSGSGVDTSDASQFRSLSTQMTDIDIDIPYNGELYVFTTPQGDIDISFRAVSNEVRLRSFGLFIVLLCIGAAYACYRLGRSRLNSRV